MVVTGIFSSATDEWETPQHLFDQLDDQYLFTLDVCATPQNAKCRRYYTKEQNGLSQDWSGETVWCNPPYGRQIRLWVEKCSKHTGTAVMLLPARTDTGWFHDFILRNEKATVFFIRKRLKFENSTSNAPFPSIIVEFSPNEKARVSKSHGYCGTISKSHGYCGISDWGGGSAKC